MQLSAAQLYQLFPTAKAELVAAIVSGWHLAVAANITTPRRVRQFLSNVGVETGGLRSIVENMNYTTVAQIRRTWPGRFPTDASAQPYVSQPKKLAIKVYGGRMGNAPHPSEDGWTYRGRSMLQTSGREGYRRMGFEHNPDALADPATAFRVAVREWQQRGLNALADRDDTEAVRRGINGGTIGLSEVRAYLDKARQIWPDTGAAVPPTFTDAATVKAVQSRLRDLGYTEVGNVDGKMGQMTRAAILVFRDDQGMALEPVIDQALLDTLKAAPHRSLAKERGEASPKKVREQVPEVRSNFITKIVSMISGFFAAVAAAINGIMENFSEARGYIDPVMAYLSSIPGWVFLLVIAAIALALYLVARKGETAGIDAYQQGARR